MCVPLCSHWVGWMGHQEDTHPMQPFSLLACNDRSPQERNKSFLPLAFNTFCCSSLQSKEQHCVCILSCSNIKAESYFSGRRKTESDAQPLHPATLQLRFFLLQVLPTFVVGEFVFMALSLILLIHAIKQVMRIRRNHGSRADSGRRITRLHGECIVTPAN